MEGRESGREETEPHGSVNLVEVEEEMRNGYIQKVNGSDDRQIRSTLSIQIGRG